MCNFCNLGEVDDEEHFLLRCSVSVNQRNKMLECIYSECTNFRNLGDPDKLFYLLNSEDRCVKAVARYCYECFELRNATSMNT